VTVDDIAARTVRGLRWDYARTAVIVAAQVGYTVVMARLLEPEAFGLFAVGLVVVGFGRYLAQTGLALAVVQKRHLNRDDVRAAFTASVALGIAIAVATAASAPLAARFFGEPALLPVLQLMALSFVLVGFSNTAEALLQRGLSFRAIAVADVLAYLVGYVGVGVVLAAAGYGVWSLVASLLAQSAISGALYYLNARHTLLPTLRRTAYRGLLPFGTLASLAGVVEYAVQNLDTLVIGRVLGAAPLGLYNRASLLIRIPVHHLAYGLVRVLFPSLSRLQDDPAAFRWTYYRSLAAAASLLLPIGAGVAAAAFPIVEVALGERWIRSAPVLTIIACAAPLHLLTEITASAWGALGRMRTRLAVQSAFLALMAVALSVAAPYGLVGLSVAVLAVEGVRHAFFALMTAMRLRPGREQLLEAYGWPLLTAVLTAAAITAADALLVLSHGAAAWRLATGAAVGGLVLASAIWWGPLRHLRPLLARALRGGWRAPQ
jgi:lipopolysaccharide exporter